jgi:L-rhamnose mutarotase
MHRLAFTMQLFKGCEEEYRKRHNQLWPELRNLLKEAGISDYSIFLEESSGCLFAVLTCADPQAVDQLAASSVMKQWWAYMKDIMETNDDNSPVTKRLPEVFFLP